MTIYYCASTIEYPPTIMTLPIWPIINSIESMHPSSVLIINSPFYMLHKLSSGS